MTLNQNELSDVDLISRVVKMDKSAFGILYDRYSQLVFNLANKIVKDSDYAGEVMQSVFIQIWNKSSSYNEKKGAVSTWIINITRNKSIDLLRRTKKDKLNIYIEFDELESPNNYDTTISEINERNNVIKKVMGEIPEEQRAIIEMIYLEGYTQKEVSEKLNIPLGTVKTRIHLGIAKLRDILSPYMREI